MTRRCGSSPLGTARDSRRRSTSSAHRPTLHERVQRYRRSRRLSPFRGTELPCLIGDQAFNAASIVPSSSELVVPVAQPGQPATLLQRRPDLLALNAQLDAANSRRQQAHAEWFPRLFLGALFGRESVERQRSQPRLGAIHQCTRAADDAALQLGADTSDQRHRREQSSGSAAPLRRWDRACARGRREHAGCAAR